MRSLFQGDFLLAQFYLLLPALGTVELLVVLAEVEAAVVEALVEVFGCHFFAELLELRPAAAQLSQLLPQPGHHYSCGYFSRSVAHHADHVGGIDVAQDAQHERVAEPPGLLDEANGGLEGGQVGIDFVLLLLVF